MANDLLSKAKRWAKADLDNEHRTTVEDLVRDRDEGRLRELFDGSLTFGTAGIRGEVGPGPNRMNRSVVVRTTRGLADHLISAHGSEPTRPVIVGFDARPTSAQFAEDTVGVLAAAGSPVLYFPGVVPTPIVAFAAKHLEAIGAVVITASHNPRWDNGYKVYGDNAAQIIPPDDTSIATAIEGTPMADRIPRLDQAFSTDHELVRTVPHDIVDSYWAELSAARPDAQTSHMKIVYTPLHGVGGSIVESLFRQAGHTGLIPVAEQFEPEGSFPTVDFPNPEEPGALDLALAHAVEVDADLVLANDPDADRLAVVVPSEDGEWRALSGNEVGALLGDYVLRHHRDETTPIVVSSIVSSPMLGRIAAVYGARHETTLTGFKWIVSAGLSLEAEGEGRFVYGYEEALGYSIGSTVRDKDGISAALVFADLAAGLAKASRTVLERLVEIWEVSGLWVSAQHSIVRTGGEGAAAIQDAMARLAADPPRSVGGVPVVSCRDYHTGADDRPTWLGEQALVELSLGREGRLLARPSGTEPKLKIYADLRGECGDDAFAAHDELSSRADLLAGELANHLAI